MLTGLFFSRSISNRSAAAMTFCRNPKEDRAKSLLRRRSGVLDFGYRALSRYTDLTRFLTGEVIPFRREAR
jgi:hypothetical protein